jgi:hypothetical protein
MPQRKASAPALRLITTNGCLKSYQLLHLQQICSEISPLSCSFHIDRRPGQRATVRSFMRFGGRGYQREAGVSRPTNDTETIHLLRAPL